MLAHLSRGVGGDFDAVRERHAKDGVGEHFVDDALHFDHLFLRHRGFLKGERRRAQRHEPPGRAQYGTRAARGGPGTG
jgi:hypothetical protein